MKDFVLLPVDRPVVHNRTIAHSSWILDNKCWGLKIERKTVKIEHKFYINFNGKGGSKKLMYLPVGLRLVLHGANVDVVVGCIVSGAIGGIAAPFATTPFSGRIESWSSLIMSISSKDLVEVGLKTKSFISTVALYQRNIVYSEIFSL